MTHTDKDLLRALLPEASNSFFIAILGCAVAVCAAVVWSTL